MSEVWSSTDRQVPSRAAQQPSKLAWFRELVPLSAEFELAFNRRWVAKQGALGLTTICPLTQTPLVDIPPHDLFFAEDKQIYSRQALSAYVVHEAGHSRVLRSPVTREKLVRTTAQFLFPEVHAVYTAAFARTLTICSIPIAGAIFGTLGSAALGAYKLSRFQSGCIGEVAGLAGATLLAVGANLGSTVFLCLMMKDSMLRKPVQDWRAAKARVERGELPALKPSESTEEDMEALAVRMLEADLTQMPAMLERIFGPLGQAAANDDQGIVRGE